MHMQSKIKVAIGIKFGYQKNNCVHKTSMKKYRATFASAMVAQKRLAEWSCLDKAPLPAILQCRCKVQGREPPSLS